MGITNPTVHIPTGDPTKTNVPSLQHPGDLGRRFPFNEGEDFYRRVKVDTGATSATPSGAIANNHTAYWKDRRAFLVTNDIRMAEGGVGRNSMAGIFRLAATAGYYVDVHVSGPAATVLDDAGRTAVAGDKVIPSGTSTKVATIAQGTAPTHDAIGDATGPAVAGVLTVRLNVPDID